MRPRWTADDAAGLKIVTLEDALEAELAFDHDTIIAAVYNYFHTGGRPTP